MPTVPHTGRVAHFGVFELDLRSAELRKSGVKIRLQEQPFQVLAALLEHPGAVVTREELINRLWPDGTVVDYEHSLGTAVNKIRQALGDSADNPRFVETVPRRGYRFIYPVERPAPLPVGARHAVPAGTTPTVPSDTDQARSPIQRAWMAGLVVLALIAAGITWWLSRSSQPAPLPDYKLTQLTFDTGLTFEPTISSDGKLVAYASDRAGGGNLDIWVQQVGGEGEPTRLTADAAKDHQPHFSPDGKMIAFCSDRDNGGIYLVSALGGQPRLLVEGKARLPRFSPDGKWIAYDNRGVWVVPVSGGESKRVLPEDLPDSATGLSIPIWLPDSRRVLVQVGFRSLVDAIRWRPWYVVPIDGDFSVKTDAVEVVRSFGLIEKINLPEQRSFPRASTWLPDRGAAIFSATQGDRTDLWALDIDTETGKAHGEPRRLNAAGEIALDASVSTDGRLVYASLRARTDIWSLAVNANSGKLIGEKQQLTDNAAADERPFLSKNGTMLVYISDRSGNAEVWVREMESGKERRLTFDEPARRIAQISADGSRVAYRSMRGDALSTDVVSVKGGAARKFCDDCGGVMDWTPDGKKALDGGREISLVDVDSGETALILQSPQWNLWEARFSPDGEWIVFHCIPRSSQFYAHIGRKLYIAPFRGATPIPPEEWIPAVTDPSARDMKGWWSPDGNLLYFMSDRDGYSCIWAQHLEPATKKPVGQPFEVYPMHETQRYFGNAGVHTMSVAPDRIVFNLSEYTGNIWMMEPQE